MLLLTALTALAHAGWPQPQGAHYAKLGGRVLFGRKAFHSGLAAPSAGVDIDTITDAQAQFYTEYGLTDTWTLVAQGNPIGRAAFRDASMIYAGPLRLGVRRGLASGRHNLALQLGGSYTPSLGTADLTDGAYEGLVYIPGVSTARAHGQLSYGRGFDEGRWLKAFAGGDWASADDIHPGVAIGLQLGRNINDAHRLVLNVQTRTTLGPEDEIANFSAAGNRDLVALSIGYAFQLGGGWGVGTSFDTGAAVGSALGGGIVPAYVEHSGGS